MAFWGSGSVGAAVRPCHPTYRRCVTRGVGAAKRSNQGDGSGGGKALRSGAAAAYTRLRSRCHGGAMGRSEGNPPATITTGWRMNHGEVPPEFGQALDASRRGPAPPAGAPEHADPGHRSEARPPRGRRAVEGEREGDLAQAHQPVPVQPRPLI